MVNGTWASKHQKALVWTSLCDRVQICLWAEMAYRHMVLWITIEIADGVGLWEWWWLAEMALGYEERHNLRKVACMRGYTMGCYGRSSLLEHYRWGWRKRNW